MSRQIAALASAGLAAALAGCSAPPPVPAAATLPALPTAWRGAADPADNLAERPYGDVFRDAELAALIAEALRNNRDLRIAAQRVELARAQYGIQDSARWPTLAADASATRQQAPSVLSATDNLSSTVYRAGLALPAWEIDLWGRLRALSDSALRNLESTDALRRFVQVGLVSRVASGWLDLLEIDQALEISRRTARSRAESLRIVALRFDAGVVSKVDVTQAQTALAQAEAATAQLLERRGRQENALSTLAGRYPGPLQPSRPLASYPLPPSLPAGIPATLLMRRPDVRAAELALAASQASVEAAQKAFLPAISLTGFLGFVSPQLSQLIDADRIGYTVQPAITLPLFTGGRLTSSLEGAQAQQALATEDYARTVQAALREVEDALVRFEQQRAQQAAISRVVDASRERLRLVELRYSNGISGYFEVLDAQRQLFDAELQLTQLTSGAYASVIELYRALGGGWTPQ
ncbi:MAG: efflux transporter outer membrane subunit [Burkholderiaceae bacterium]|nr:efflux transporter outer membrane subunit [Burkholderiaceae bacterium]